MKKNYLYAFSTVFIWATMATVVKALLNNIPNLEALSISGIFAFVFMLIMNVRKEKLKKLKEYRTLDIVAMCGLGFLGLFMYSALYYYGLTLLTSQEACILNYLWPIMLVIFSSLILKEKLTVVKCLAIGCLFVGIIILSMGGGQAYGNAHVLGVVVCIAAAACYGLFCVLNKKADYDQDITMMVIWAIVTICALILGLLAEQWVIIQGIQWFGMLWLGIVIDALAYLLWALALKGTKNTASIANLAYLTPFISIVISAAFLKEIITINAVIALMFIVGGILIQQIFEKKGTGI